MFWTCPGYYKVHVHGLDSPGHPVHGHCPVPLPALPSSIKLCGSVPKAGESVSVSKCGGKLVSVFKASAVSVSKAGKPISVSKGDK